MKMIKHSIQVTLSVLVFMISAPVFADIAIIVNAQNKMDKIELKQAAQIFLKKVKKFPVGGKAEPVLQNEGSSLNKSFNEIVLKKNESTLKAYWSKVVFTGKAIPPKSVPTDEEVIKVVSENINAIGYIDSSKVNEKVKAILTIK